jgi:hypothetical protein
MKNPPIFAHPTLPRTSNMLMSSEDFCCKSGDLSSMFRTAMKRCPNLQVERVFVIACRPAR